MGVEERRRTPSMLSGHTVSESSRNGLGWRERTQTRSRSLGSLWEELSFGRIFELFAADDFVGSMSSPPDWRRAVGMRPC